jgi:uncharacterized protein (TIGR03435 family)
MRLVAICALLSLPFPSAPAQSSAPQSSARQSSAGQAAAGPSAKAPTFDAASVKVSPHDGRGFWASSEGGRINYVKITLSNLLIIAYQLKDYQLEGPRWIFTESYDVQARAAARTTKDQMHLMLQSLLAERFNLKVHRDWREMPAYELTTGKSVLRLKDAPPNGTFAMVKGRREAKGMSMLDLAGLLTTWLHTPVLDKTKLPGTFDFRLELSKEEAGPAGADKALLSVFTNLQEVGLQLESKKDPMDVLVVDSGNPVPTEE